MSSYNRQLAIGSQKGKRALNVFAFSENVGTTPEDLWQGKILTPSVSDMTYMIVADFLLIKSTSADDDFTGTGTQIVSIDYVDENYLRVTELLNMNGLTGVQTSKKSLGVNGIVCVTNGVLGESNKGIITAEALGAGDPQCIIDIEHGINQDSHVFIPADEQGIITRLTLTGEKNAEYKIVFEITGFINQVLRSSKVISIPFIFFQSSFSVEFEIPPVMPSASRIRIIAVSDQGTANSLSGSFDLELSKLGVS